MTAKKRWPSNPILVFLVLEKENPSQKTSLEQAVLSTFEFLLETVAKKISNQPPNQIKNGLEVWAKELNPLRVALNVLLRHLDFDGLEKSNEEEIYRKLYQDARISSFLEEEKIKHISKIVEESSTIWVTGASIIKFAAEIGVPPSEFYRILPAASATDFLLFSILSFLDRKATLSLESIDEILLLFEVSFSNYKEELSRIEKKSQDLKILKEYFVEYQSLGFASFDMPPTFVNEAPLTNTSADSVSLSKNWIQQNSQKYQGKWIAVLHGELIGCEEKIDRLYKNLDEKWKTNKDLILTKVGL